MVKSITELDVETAGVSRALPWGFLICFNPTNNIINNLFLYF
ncbi:MAG: hypothetical protein V1734_04595 [Nanoarchaeota archaeon]